MIAQLAKFAALCAAALSVQATPISFVPADEGNIFWSPDITSPGLLSVWTVGANETVTWDPSKVPQSNINDTGLLLLGYQENGSENLDISTPLATGFPISAGQVSLTVPNVTERHDYIVVLFGDSGNASPIFTIKQ
ncbi:predicted protein [Postia placenta Mad-698-R]|nr:predicted protein [Postia placenta Mad-698-R]